MNEKELRKLSRVELLEMLVEMSRENDVLRSRIEDLRCELERKELAIGKAGSIAEASVAVNGVFEAAQSAAEQYLLNISNQEVVCKKMVADAEAEAARIIAEAEDIFEAAQSATKQYLFSIQRPKDVDAGTADEIDPDEKSRLATAGSEIEPPADAEKTDDAEETEEDDDPFRKTLV